MPSLLSNFTIAITTILGYSAMSGIIGGGGLGKIAINYGYYRYKYLVMIFAVILLIALASAPTLQQRQTRDSRNNQNQQPRQILPGMYFLTKSAGAFFAAPAFR